ncbi:MAG: NADP-dependent oxidoreductase [Verrucomicrobia bacterium]|nr:NADP-dependent oxidoreductase [Verrucomicrobiota bacterium]
MKAVGIREFGGREVMELMQLPDPQPGPGEVRIRVRAAGVNPVDWKIREGWLKDFIPHEFPIVLGWDAAGVIDLIGPGVTDFVEGNTVYAYCRKPVIHGGTYAERVVVPASSVALKPKRTSFSEAASIPLAGLTAFQSLFDEAALKEGETVLIHAAAGGVGGFAVQLAKHRRARVIGTASLRNHDYVRNLGADHVIDYRSVDFRKAVLVAQPGGVDVAYDCVGGPALAESVEVLKPGGRLVSIVEPTRTEELREDGVDATFVFVEPSGSQLKTLADLVDSGEIKTSVSAELPLEEFEKAHTMIESHHTRGKIVLIL